MKSIVYLIAISLLLLAFIKIDAQVRVFIPNESIFIQKSVTVETESIQNICAFFGYNSEQYHTYMNFDELDGEIVAVIFKVFTESIICVITNGSNPVLLSSSVNRYLSKFSWHHEYNAYEIESILKDGVKQRTLTSDYLAEVLSMDRNIANGSITVPLISYELTFANGYLVKYVPSDGLNKWARDWKNNQPETYFLYEAAAREHWSDNEAMILNELNVQADAYARTPDAAGNEYVHFHMNVNGTVNFKMLLVTHYKESIGIKAFRVINLGRYDLVNEYNDSYGNKLTTYKVNFVQFTFNEEGILVSSFASK